jgi:hypothetical protein
MSKEVEQIPNLRKHLSELTLEGALELPPEANCRRDCSSMIL